MNTFQTVNHVEKARNAWGDSLPDWVLALAEDATKNQSQSVTAKKIGYSVTAVSNIIGNKYTADTGPIEAAVRAKLMCEEIDCPEVGPMPLARCHEWRARCANVFQPLSSTHLTMRKACAACKHNGGSDA
jgi:hypothetical protein